MKWNSHKKIVLLFSNIGTIPEIAHSFSAVSWSWEMRVPVFKPQLHCHLQVCWRTSFERWNLAKMWEILWFFVIFFYFEFSNLLEVHWNRSLFVCVDIAKTMTKKNYVFSLYLIKIIEISNYIAFLFDDLVWNCQTLSFVMLINYYFSMKLSKIY